MADLSNWLTEKQAADVLNISERHVERYLSREGVKTQLPPSTEHPQPTWVYDPAAVEAVRASFEKRNIEANLRLKDLAFNNPEIHAVYQALGYSPWLREEMTVLAGRVLECCDPDSFAALEGSTAADPKVLLTPNGASALQIGLMHCPLAYGDVRVPVQHLWDWAVEARTDLLHELSEFGSPEGNRVSANNIRSILNAVNAFDPEELPPESCKRKSEFDYVLWRIEVKIPREDESDRPADLAFVAAEYLRAGWMHNRFLTERLVRDIFRLVRKEVGNMPVPPLWPAFVTGAGVPVFYYSRLRALTFISLAATLLFFLPAVLRARRVNRLVREIDRVARELEDDWFSGKVLAERVERIYQQGGAVPSVLPALLELLP